MSKAPMMLSALVLASLATAAQPAARQAAGVQQTPAPAPAGQAPAAPSPAGQRPAQPPSTAAPVSPPLVPPVTLGARTFTAKTGLLLQSVRPERVADFEAVLGFLQDALERVTDPAVRAQAQGWRIFKAAEPGPNGTVLYVFVIDPAVPGADYGLGRILAEAYPDRIQEIWKLYQGSLAPSASLLNLMPVEPGALVPPAAAPAATSPAAPTRPAPVPQTPAPSGPGSAAPGERAR